MASTTYGRAHGLTTAGAAVVALVPALAGAGWDIGTGTSLRTVSTVGFVAGVVLAALLVQRRRLACAAVQPPLVYLATAVLAAGVRGSQGGRPGISRRVLDVFTVLVLHAPALLLGTGAAVAIVLVRAAARRRQRAPQAADDAAAPASRF